ncbi:Autoinducer 2 sensor kinase/phosphatase LuxQ [Fundidesulfovibrio magnetotacticus]|uniref:histidine kinase n=1 Tax=Fundidesulfovibrio magnetotacticus TaxID=2730080 RepID=A0A6V8LTL6_9BACT|nr:response regulator [Fundidesulfovibrio magnetotacticus]GFK95074.1 Autoinducer 2 sensor kinase/phosphatase LuxQ [Fundidesulfovibrio magnetotacticus]
MASPLSDIPCEFEELAQKAPVSIMYADREGIVCFVNDWHLQHFARGQHDRTFFLGRHLLSLPGIASSGAVEVLRPALEGKDVFIEKLFTAEFSGGQSGYQTIRASGIKSGRLAGGVVVIREDVTRWVELEQSRRDDQQRTLALLNATQDSVVLLDPDGRFVLMNEEAARRRGKSVQELTGKSLYRHMDPDAARFRRAMAEKALASRTPVEYEENSQRRTYWVSIYPVLDQEGRVTHLASFSKDITDRKHMEQALLQARQRAEASFEAKTQFLANMSHELRTPLNGILGAVQLSQDDALDEEQRELWGIVRESGERLLRSVNSLLDLADISSHALQPVMRPFDLRRAAASVARSFEVQARLKNLDLLVEFEESIPGMVTGDEFRLRKILANLLANALACTERGSVLLSVSLVDEEHLRKPGAITCAGGLSLLFMVEDTGVGITPDKLPHIFESFTLAEDTRTKTRSGAGMGLAIARSLVELLGGRIWVTSAPGQGSRFHFTASFWTQSEHAETSPAPRAPAPGCSGARVLLAEDEQVTRVMAGLMLARMGYHVVEASDGQEALKALRDHACDVVLMDIQMPVMDGITATRMVRNGELPGVDRHIPIIAFTSYASDRDRIRLLREGMDALLPKPFEAEDLALAIEKALSARTH